MDKGFLLSAAVAYLIIVVSCSAQVCETSWTCSQWSGCSGGVSSRICRDLNECEGWLYEEKPCGGFPFHWNFPNSGDYISYVFRDGDCADGMRICGSGGVVECQDGRLHKVEECKKCLRGVCLEKEYPVFDSIGAFYLVLNLALIGFGVYLFYYSAIYRPRNFK